MNASDVTRELIHLARRFRESGTQSISALLRETGYSVFQNQITVRDIGEALADNVECISVWMQYSEDKRSRSGWYFKQEASGEFVVGYLGENCNSNTLGEYDNDVDACATFIKYEIDDIRRAEKG